ncbi:pre-rRNA-processing protein [Acrasis kona]|uniref:Pre-rRNA-processing protein n=1 Tax=Acrasis kona TaxID=1008807 RepID=A0AAW2Z1L7_9EUKA
MSSMPPPVHRPGKFKQVNKPFKSKHSTKGEAKRKAGGKISGERRNLKSTANLNQNLSREQRRNRAKQIRDKKRQDILHLRRIGSNGGPPKLVAILPLGPGTNQEKIYNDIVAQNNTEESPVIHNFNSCTLRLTDFSQNITLFQVQRTQRSVLDAAKIADLFLMIISPEGVDQDGEDALALLRAQGFPTTIVVIQNLESVPAKKRNDIKRNLVKWSQDQIPRDPRVVTFDEGEQDIKQLCRWINEQQVREVHWREKRPYMLIDRYEFTPDQVQQPSVTAPGMEGLESLANKDKMGTLVVYGYLRGRNATPNQLFHLTNFGTYQVKEIKECNAPLTKLHQVEVLEDQKHLTPDERQETLIGSLVPDTLNNEQTWPTKEDFENDTYVKKVPKGFDSYQAAWVPDDYYPNSDDEDEDDESYVDSDMNMEQEIHSDDEDDNQHDDYMISQSETQTSVDKFFRIEEDEKMTEEERQAEYERVKRMREEETDDAKFPDEVDTPIDTPARIRFAKYRGLKNFKNSPWDSKENLPLDYARIFQFENINASAKASAKELQNDDLINQDRYVAISLINVPGEKIAAQSLQLPLQLFGLLRHEQKSSVVHFLVKKSLHYEEPIKSRDELIAQVGFRTFKCNPIFSEHNPRNDKHRFERFLQPSRFLCASVFMPITFKPAPILLFKRNANSGKLDLVAHGSTMNADPDRIMVKKIILTGHPYKVHKKQAVVRFMFHNPDDIKWFQPVELHTKFGRHGVITQSVGTHGYMKCMFDDGIKGQDTICMALYKRVYPKWTTEVYSMLASPAQTNDIEMQQ